MLFEKSSDDSCISTDCSSAASRSFTKSVSVLAACMSVLMLSGCEAPLKLEAVKAQRAKDIQRTDMFQAMVGNGTTHVLVGNNGVVLTRQDGASGWTRTDLEGEPSLLDVDVCPDNTFIALSFDNSIWAADANGENWQEFPTESYEQLMTAACAPNGDWWVGGSYSTLMNSSDKGASWNTQSLDEDTIITNLEFLSADEAVATAEYGMVITTTDAGESWEVTGYVPDEFYPHTAHFVSMDEGWVGGLNGFIYHTTDGGNEWERQKVAVPVPIYQFIDVNGTMYALGDNAVVLNYVDDEWKVVQPPSAPIYLRAGDVVDGQLVVAGGYGLTLAVNAASSAAEAE